MPDNSPTLLPAPDPGAGGRTPAARLRALGLRVGDIGVVGLCLVWCYWPTLLSMADRWSHDPQYSHGFLVPVFAAVVLWHRRALLPDVRQPVWWGALVLLLAVLVRLGGAFYVVGALESFSLIPAIAGLVLLLGGWAALRWSWPAIAFLAFMMPLPYVLDMLLAQPLRHVATLASTYCLQTFGYPALAEGNIIEIEDVKLGVIDACSGLGMLMTFFALSTAMALIIQRRPADKVLMVVSAVPIAVIANVTRITATGVVHCEWGARAGELLHDGAGWLMMPLALGLLWLELRLLDRLLVEGGPTTPLGLDLGGAVRALPYSPGETQPLPCGPCSSPELSLDHPTAPHQAGR
jgi:exosortase